MDESLTVLLAEDNRDESLLIQRAFHRNGVMKPVHIVPDGEECINYLLGAEQYADRIAHPFPNILILDLKMPRVSGFDVLEWLNDHPDYRVIPTIVWSGSSDTRDVKHAFCAGANAYLCKPISYEKFVAMVGRLIAFWDDCLKPGVEPAAPNCESLTGRKPFSGAHGL